MKAFGPARIYPKPKDRDHWFVSQAVECCETYAIVTITPEECEHFDLPPLTAAAEVTFPPCSTDMCPKPPRCVEWVLKRFWGVTLPDVYWGAYKKPTVKYLTSCQLQGAP